MSVNDGQKANDTTFNDAFVSRITDSDTIAKIDLKDPDTPAITDVQATINTQRTDIDQNRTDIDTNDTELADHESRISTNETNITDLQNDTMDLTTNQTAAGEKTFSADAFFSQDVTITGDLTVDGTQTILNTATLEVEDKNVVINNGGDDTSAEGAGLTVERTGTDGSLVYEDALDNKFKVGPVGSELEIGTLIQDTEVNILAIVSPSTSSRYYATDTGKNFLYDAQTTSFLEVGSGGGGGVGDIDYLTLIEDFDSSDGLTTEVSGVNGSTFRLTHDASVTKFAEKTIAVTNKFKDKVLALRLDKRSTASSGNFKVIITDETNTLTLADEIIQPQADGVTTDKKLVTFSTAQPDGGSPVASIKVRFEALAEAGAPYSEFDDVVVDLNTTESRSITATIQETNTFSARIANNGTASITSQSESFISSVNRTALGEVEVTFKPSFFSVIPSVVATPSKATSHSNFAGIKNPTTSSVTILSQNDAGAYSDFDIEVSVTRQGSDYRNIEKRVEREVSTFKEVIQETKDLTVEAAGNAGEVITANTTDIPFILVSDNSGGWDGATYTVPEDGVYNFSGGVNKTDSLGLQINIYIDGVFSHLLGGTSNSTVVPFGGTASLIKGQVVSLRADVTKTLSNSTVYHNLYISKVGVPKIATVAPDSKIKIPTSELRMELATSNGTGAEARTVKFDSTAKIRGDAFTVDSTNGTIITIEKDGFVSISCNVYESGASREITAVTLNASDPANTPLVGEVISESIIGDQTGANLFTNLAGSTFVKAGDKIRVYKETAPDTITYGNYLNITHQEQDIQVAVSNVTPQYEDADTDITTSGYNGYGSVNNKILRLSSVDKNLDTSAYFQDSATDGSSFTIKEDGVYSISLRVGYTNGPVGYFGLSLNSTELTTSIYSINNDDVIAMDYAETNGRILTANRTISLSEGDIIRPHTAGQALNISPQECVFTITKQANPSITEVDVTPFVDLQDQGWKVNSLKLEGNSGQSVTANTTDIPFSGGGKGWNGTSYTVQNEDAVIELKIGLKFTVSLTSSAGIYKNGTHYKNIISGVSTSQPVASFISSKGEFVTGDVLTIRVGSSLTLSDVSDAHYLNINEWYRADQYERIYAVEQNENEFSCIIGNDGAAASITRQSLGFIDTVTRDGTGLVTINFKNGFFTDFPAVTTSADSGSNVYATIDNLDLNSVSIQIRNDGGTAVDSDFHAHISRQGADRKDLQRQLASISDFPRVNNQLTQGFSFNSLASTMTASSGDLRWGANLTTSGDSILSYDDSTGHFEALISCEVNASISLRSGSSIPVIIRKNNSTYSAERAGASNYGSASGSILLNRGDYLDFWTDTALTSGSNQYMTITAQAQELERVTNVDQQENVFSAEIEGSLNVIVGNAVTVLSENTSFIKSVTHSATTGTWDIVWNDGFFTEAPTVLVTQSTPAVASVFFKATSSSTTGVSIQCVDFNGALRDEDYNIIVQRQGDDYKSLTDIVLALPVPKVAFLKDVKVSGVSAGTFTGGAWQTRDLNIVSGDSEIVSLSSNQFTLTAGKYIIEGRCPGYQVDTHKGRLFDITNSVVVANGSNTRTSTNVGTDSKVTANITIIENTVFELQHRCATTKTINGLGINLAGSGDEVYAEVKITKLN